MRLFWHCGAFLSSFQIGQIEPWMAKEQAINYQ